MNLGKLFEMQEVLDERIVKEQHLPTTGNLDWKILALQVELGECANEWRGFKKWSKDQEPRNILFRWTNGIGKEVVSRFNPSQVVENFNGKYLRIVNPLLEEYVDCLHFILSIGNYIECQSFERLHRISFRNDITQKFNVLFKLIANLEEISILLDSRDYKMVFNEFIELGEMLGFTWDQVESAYYAKNEINHVRQSEGY